MNPKPDDIALNILANVIRTLGPHWESRLTDADRALVRACCNDAARALRDATVNDSLILAEQLRVAHARLGAILGIDATEAMLDALFGRFCIGK